MATGVVNRDELMLNGVRYKISGGIRRHRIARFPGRINTGDDEYSNEVVFSNLIINDKRGGVGIEEMDEAIHQERDWFSTADTRFRGAIFLPPLATAITPPYPRINYSFDSDGGVWADPTQAYDNDTGTAATEAIAATSWTDYLILNFTATKTISGFRWRSTGYNAGLFNLLEIDTAPDGAAYTTRFDGSSTTQWEASVWNYVYLGADLDIKNVRLRAYNADSGGNTFSVYELQVIETANGSAQTGVQYINWNSKLWMAMGANLLVLNAGGTAFESVAVFPASITKLERSIDNELYIFIGDTENYWHMTTAYIMKDGGSTGATLGTHWDNKLAKVDSAGAIETSADPNAAAPTWTAKGSLEDTGVADGEVEDIFVYRDADANLIIYAATNTGLFAHDFTNAQWLATEIQLASHPNGGIGNVWWQDALYHSRGLHMIKYQAASTAVIQAMGLDRDGGVPAEYRGEFKKLISSDNEFFGLVDASIPSGTQYSTVMGWNGESWNCWWADASADRAMYCGVISTTPDYRLWFCVASVAYWIQMLRDVANPLKDSTYTYAASAIHIEPWFNAGTAVWNKTAKKITLRCRGMSANETVVVKYRTNHTNTDRDTGWTTLGTIVASGQTEYTFGTSGVGVSFNAIQFRFDLARGGTTTNTPVIESAVFSYLRRGGKAWAFLTTVELSQAEDVSSTSKAQFDALIAAEASETLLEAIWNDGTDSSQRHYVFLEPFSGQEPTGFEWNGRVALTMVEP